MRIACSGAAPAIPTRRCIRFIGQEMSSVIIRTWLVSFVRYLEQASVVFPSLAMISLVLLATQRPTCSCAGSSLACFHRMHVFMAQLAANRGSMARRLLLCVNRISNYAIAFCRISTAQPWKVADQESRSVKLCIVDIKLSIRRKAIQEIFLLKRRMVLSLSQHKILSVYQLSISLASRSPVS